MAGIGDLSGMLGKVKDMQANMQRMQDELAQRTVEAASGGGMVNATVNGKGELIAVKIDKSVIDPQDSEMLEDLVKAAVNAAVEKSQQMMQEEMAKMTGGLNLPGLDQIGKMFG